MSKFIVRVLRFKYVDQLALVVLIGVSTYLLIGDFGVRLANTSTDDGLVSYAYFFKFPERFAQDAHMLNWGPVGLTSMLNWLPAVLFKYAGVPPEIVYGLFTFLQNILLALAVYRLTMVMTQSRESAWIAAIFTLTFRPHWWNMGLFADLDWMPYSAWSALPFLVFAGSYALEQRVRATSVMLLIGGLVHPILGLFAAAMFGGYWILWSLRERNLRGVLVSFAVLGTTVIVFLLPVLVAKLGVEEAPSSQILDMVLKNGHALPWVNPGCAYCMPLFLKSLFVIPVLTALALVAAGHISTHPGLRLFLLACFAVTLAACVLHAVAYFTHNATILRVISSRSTILLLIFAVPPAIAFAWRQFREAGPFGRLVAGYFLVLPSPAAIMAALLVLPGAKNLRQADARGTWLSGVCQAIGAALFALVLARHVPRLREFVDLHIIESVMGPSYKPLFFAYHSWGYQLPKLSALIAVALCLLVAWQWHVSARHKSAMLDTQKTALPAVAVLTIMLVTYLLTYNYTVGLNGTRGEAREYYEVQVWARTSTPVEARFIVSDTSVYESWRNFTHRARISPGGCGFYICSKAALAEGKKTSAFHARHGNVGYSGFDTAGLREYARTFGGEFAVRRRAWAPVNLPIAFQNAGYVVYDLR
ncbi:MAG: hypothetical protein ABL891_16005 [Burkholderiales bacterium]